ncbi:hypothetical protein DL764_010879 [Monosporascus ibericus]|uniref:GATA-type domain-containing protein n=1 Tax=Monosporascus ibericus TaxID=155417 RepID=A0A4Q4SUA4_9PEZI|nr:hypothetical protein DL764_010879 [Monosporascus ibericus]
MSSSIPLAIRLAGAAQPPQQVAEPQRTTSASSSIKPNAAESTAAAATAAGRAGGGGDDGRGNHQFWLGEIKIAENLYTVSILRVSFVLLRPSGPALLRLNWRRTGAAPYHTIPCPYRNQPSASFPRSLTVAFFPPSQIHRSAKDLVDFAAQLIGHFDKTTGNNQPIGIMSDGDVVFMTELTNDIVRGVGGITAVRNHGMRARKRKSRHHQESERNHHQGGVAGGASRGDGDHGQNHDYDEDRDPEQSVSSSKRVQLTPEAEQRSKGHSSNSNKRACQRCGRTDTPEWRTGPEGRKTLCNVCGLLYAKQRGRSRKSTEAVASNVSSRQAGGGAKP